VTQKSDKCAPINRFIDEEAADMWNAWTRPTITYQGLTYISGNDPIFTHQYSHAWLYGYVDAFNPLVGLVRYRCTGN